MFDDQEKRFALNEGEAHFNVPKLDVSFSEYIEEREKNSFENAMKKYMPIGTIVQTSINDNLLMIVGYKENGCDYIGCLYPSGMTSSTNLFWFNHDQIKRVFYVGYNNGQGEYYREQLNQQNSEIRR